MGDNIENRVSALSIGTKIGFLDLSANTRNQIYDLLLLNRSPEGDLHVINVVDSPSRRQSGYGPYRRYLDGRALKPNYHWRAPVAEPNNSCNFMYPAILRTCKQVRSFRCVVLFFRVELELGQGVISALLCVLLYQSCLNLPFALQLVK
jgi:hypothetical protein